MIERPAVLARRLTWACLACLAALQLLASFLQQPPALVWVIRVAPLLIFVPGMLADNLRSYLWLCLVCLLYFLSLVERLLIAPDDPVAIMAMASLIGLFAGAGLYIKWRGEELKAARRAPESKGAAGDE